MKAALIKSEQTVVQYFLVELPEDATCSDCARARNEVAAEIKAGEFDMAYAPFESVSTSFENVEDGELLETRADRVYRTPGGLKYLALDDVEAFRFLS